MGIESLSAYQIDNNRYGVDKLQQNLALTNAANKAGAAEASSQEAFFKVFDSNTQGAAREVGGHPVIDKESKLYETCAELESFFLKTLIGSMRKTVEKSELSDTSFAGGMYEDMLYDEYTKSFSKNAGFGFADLAYLELTQHRGKVGEFARKGGF
jgi:Rod binding domain-containing protein